MSITPVVRRIKQAIGGSKWIQGLGAGTEADPWIPAVSIPALSEISAEGNEGLKVFIQDQTSPVVDLFMHRNLNTFTLDGPMVVDTKTFEAVAGHSIVSGNSVCLLEGDNFSQFEVSNVATNTISVRSPIDIAYTAAATAVHHVFDMRVDGSSAAQTYIIKPIAGQKWDITAITLVMESTANAMDFTGFGSLAALTEGIVIRKKDGEHKNLFNFKTNGEFINRCFSHEFVAKTGGGGSGFVALNVFSGPENRGVTIRLNGDNGDELQALVQDAISAVGTLTKFFIIAHGHVVV